MIREFNIILFFSLLTLGWETYYEYQYRETSSHVLVNKTPPNEIRTDTKLKYTPPLF